MTSAQIDDLALYSMALYSQGRTRTVPNASILLNTIALQKARASSEIENIFTTSDELYRGLSADSPKVSPHAKAINDLSLPFSSFFSDPFIHAGSITKENEEPSQLYEWSRLW